MIKELAPMIDPICENSQLSPKFSVLGSSFSYMSSNMTQSVTASRGEHFALQKNRLSRFSKHRSEESL